MKAAISILIGLVLSVSVSAESLIEGRVRLASGGPVAEAQVRLFDMTDLQRGAIARATTDGTGYFALPWAALTGRALPTSFALGPNYPNPFNPSTIIPYQLAASSEVRLEVFNLLGQRIATLVDGERPAGSHTAAWNATDAAGRAVGAGVYIYRMTVGVASQTGRMVLIDGQAGVSATGAAADFDWLGAEGGASEGEPVYGLIVSGEGLAPYVDSSFRVEAGMAPVELVVSAGSGKAADDDCALCDPFDALKDDDEGSSPSGKALAVLAAPAAPTNLRVEAITDSSAQVRWDAAEGATDYDVNYKPASGGKWTNQPHKGIGLYNTITDLEPNTAYRWAVRAENSDGYSAWVFGPNFTTEEEETDETTGSSDDYSNTRSGATVLSLGSSLAGQIETGSDVDYFSVQVGESGTLTVYTTGSLDTQGTLESSSGSRLASNDDGGSGSNFRIERRSVSAGTYYIKVESYRSRTGSYTIHANETPEEETETDDASEEAEEDTPEDVPDSTEIAQGLHIEFLFDSNIPQIDREAFEQAAQRWQQVILNDMRLRVTVRQEPEDLTTPRFGIKAYAELLQADEEGFPVEGRITYGEGNRSTLTKRSKKRKTSVWNSRWAEVPPPEWTVEEDVQIRMEDVATHEIGHILGIGISERWFDLVKSHDYWENPLRTLNSYGPTDLINFFFAGASAWRGFEQIQRALERDYRYQPPEKFLWYGQAPPLANDKHHWYGVLEDKHDVMGGTISQAYNGSILPRYISPLTRGALRDIGYDVALETHVFSWHEEGLMPITPTAAAPKPSLSLALFICTTGRETSF